jgi:hypothetical protein
VACLAGTPVESRRAAQAGRLNPSDQTPSLLRRADLVERQIEVDAFLTGTTMFEIQEKVARLVTQLDDQLRARDHMPNASTAETPTPVDELGLGFPRRLEGPLRERRPSRSLPNADLAERSVRGGSPDR